ncbi:MAG: hypothetical protein FJ220_07555 [Kiritimatiellaceae bacterium]|nr:hypothetical protein [Kiritimatiellaceae bacterium]
MVVRPVECYGADDKLSASLTVKVEKKREQTKENKGGGSGASVVVDTKIEHLTLLMEVENSSKVTAEYRVVWGTIGKDADNKFVLANSGTLNVSLEAGKSTEKQVKDRFELKERDSSYADSGYVASASKEVTGSVYSGYIVLVMHGNEVLAEESNSSRFLKDEWITMLKAAESGN